MVVRNDVNEVDARPFEMVARDRTPHAAMIADMVVIFQMKALLRSKSIAQALADLLQRNVTEERLSGDFPVIVVQRFQPGAMEPGLLIRSASNQSSLFFHMDVLE